VVNAKHQSGKVRELVIARPYQTVFHALKPCRTRTFHRSGL